MIKYLLKHIIIISITVILIICFFLIISCSTLVENKGSVTKNRLVYKIPVVKLNGELINIHDSLDIFYNDNFILYKLPYTRTLEDEVKILSSQINYTYFVYRKNDKYGYNFNSLIDNKSNNKKILVDSLLFIKAFVGFKFFDPKNDIFVKTFNNKKNVISVYRSIKNTDESYNDTSYFYFNNKLKNINYSFSTELDSIYRSKVYKIRLLYNEKYSPTYKLTLPKREFLFEIKEVPVDNPKEISDFIERFKEKYK